MRWLMRKHWDRAWRLELEGLREDCTTFYGCTLIEVTIIIGHWQSRKIVKPCSSLVSWVACLCGFSQIPASFILSFDCSSLGFHLNLFYDFGLVLHSIEECVWAQHIYICKIGEWRWRVLHAHLGKVPG